MVRSLCYLYYYWPIWISSLLVWTLLLLVTFLRLNAIFIEVITKLLLVALMKTVFCIYYELKGIEMEPNKMKNKNYSLSTFQDHQKPQTYNFLTDLQLCKIRDFYLWLQNLFYRRCTTTTRHALKQCFHVMCENLIICLKIHLETHPENWFIYHHNPSRNISSLVCTWLCGEKK